jgi:hypothetical protein
MVFSLKIFLFLVSQICHHTNLIEAFHTILNLCFPLSDPLYCFAHFPNRLLVFVGLATLGANSLYMQVITCLVKLQFRKRCSVFSRLLLHSAHLNGPEKPRLFRLSLVRILLWAKCQQKMLIFGGLFGFQTSLQMADLVGMSLSSRSYLYPDFTV